MHVLFEQRHLKEETLELQNLEHFLVTKVNECKGRKLKLLTHSTLQWQRPQKWQWLRSEADLGEGTRASYSTASTKTYWVTLVLHLLQESSENVQLKRAQLAPEETIRKRREPPTPKALFVPS